MRLCEGFNTDIRSTIDFGFHWAIMSDLWLAALRREVTANS